MGGEWRFVFQDPVSTLIHNPEVVARVEREVIWTNHRGRSRPRVERGEVRLPYHNASRLAVGQASREGVRHEAEQNNGKQSKQTYRN